MNLKAAAGLAQLSSLVVFVTMAKWYVVPWIRSQDRAAALIPLVWVHAFRYVALQVYSAQQAGFPISDSGRDRIVYGDVTGMLLALIAMAALRHRTRWSIPLVWLLVAETALDTVANVSGGIREHLFGAANGVTWMVVSIYVPLLMVSLGLTVWQLLSRRGEPLARSIAEHAPLSPVTYNAAGHGAR
jgi:hypothetical protein